MNEKHPADWNPRAPDVQQDQIGAYDRMRRRCPVAHSDTLHWSVFGHAEALRILSDHDSFSNVVSSHLSVPNGMDPPEHGQYRRLIEPYFSPERMAAFEPDCRQIARDLIRPLTGAAETELMDALAHPFAAAVQCAFMGWPQTMHTPLRAWALSNQQATLTADRARLSALAGEFERHIRSVLEARRGTDADDVTARLLRERVGGRPLSDAEIVSILRNWTAGELGTIAASVGIVVHYLAERPALQRDLRTQPERLPAAIDEILRIHAPLIANRRRTTRPVEIGGRRLQAGERLTLIWASANRDEAVFGDPDAFQPERNAEHNLLYGAGIHVCPGAPLARLELRVVMEELLAASHEIAPVPGKPAARASYPVGGFTAIPLRIA